MSSEDAQANDSASIAALVDQILDADEWVARTAVLTIGPQQQARPEVERALIDCVLAHKHAPSSYMRPIPGMQHPATFPGALFRSVKFEAVDMLARQARSSPAVEEMVLSLLADADSQVQDLGIYACARLRVKDSPLTTALCDLLPIASPGRQQQIIEIIGKAARIVPGVVDQLLVRLQSDPGYERLRAVESLLSLGENGPEVITAVHSCLHHDDGHVRAEALQMLLRFSGHDAMVSEAVLAGLEDPFWLVRYRAIDTDWAGAAEYPHAIEALTRRLSDDEVRIRVCAARALVENAVVTDQIISELLDCLDDEERHVASDAAHALVALIPTRPDAFEAGIDRLLVLDVQHAGLDDLLAATPASIGEGHGPVDPDLQVQRRAWEAMLEPEDVTDVLVRRLSSTDPRLRLGAARVFAGGWDFVPDVVRRLESCLSDESAEVRATAALALQYQFVSAAGIDLLIECLEDESPRMRHAAATTFGELGELHQRMRTIDSGEDVLHGRTPRIREALQALLVDPVSWVREKAVQALESLPGDSTV